MESNMRIKILLLAFLASATANADWTGNIGWASEYHFRGIFQHSSSASGGIDYESGGFYAGTWVADVGDGLEVDGYFGYGATVGKFDLSVGYTGYFYTGDFDDTYQEINLGASYGFLSLDIAIGQYDGDFIDDDGAGIAVAIRLAVNLGGPAADKKGNDAGGDQQHRTTEFGQQPCDGEGGKRPPGSRSGL